MSFRQGPKVYYQYKVQKVTFSEFHVLVGDLNEENRPC